MKRRDAMVVAGVAAGTAVLGGVGWWIVRQWTAPRDVTPVEVGDHFPRFSGKLLSGDSLTMPDDLQGDLGLLIVTWDYDGRDEVAAWARDVMETYGLLPGMHVYEVAMVSGIGPVMRRVIDRAMERQTPPPEREHVLAVYGDLRALRRQLDTAMTAVPHASVFLVGHDGRLAWRTDGPVTAERRNALREALANAGVINRSM